MKVNLLLSGGVCILPKKAVFENFVYRYNVDYTLLVFF